MRTNDRETKYSMTPTRPMARNGQNTFMNEDPLGFKGSHSSRMVWSGRIDETSCRSRSVRHAGVHDHTTIRSECSRAEIELQKPAGASEGHLARRLARDDEGLHARPRRALQSLPRRHRDRAEGRVRLRVRRESRKEKRADDGADDARDQQDVGPARVERRNRQMLDVPSRQARARVAAATARTADTAEAKLTLWMADGGWREAEGGGERAEESARSPPPPSPTPHRPAPIPHLPSPIRHPPSAISHPPSAIRICTSR